MPVVASWDGVNREIILDASVAGSDWNILDVYTEYLQERRDNETFRGFDALLRMEGGSPKGGGKFTSRSLRLLSDRGGVLTKIVPPDLGPYRTQIIGEILTDQPDTDPEPFNISGLTTAVILDYTPPDTEIVEVGSGGGGSGDPDANADAVWDELLVGHAIPGSTGAALSAILADVGSGGGGGTGTPTDHMVSGWMNFVELPYRPQ